MDIYYNKLWSTVLMVVSGISILLNLLSVLSGDEISLNIIFASIGFLIGYLQRTNPFCSLAADSSEFYNLFGKKTETIHCSSLANLEVEKNNIYYRDPVFDRRKKLPRSKWALDGEDWLNLLLLISQAKQKNNSNIS